MAAMSVVFFTQIKPSGVAKLPEGQFGQLDSADLGWAVPAGQFVH